MIDPISAVVTSGTTPTGAPSSINSPAPTGTGSTSGGVSFADMLGEQTKAMAATLHTAETTAASGITGDVGIRQVADAVMEAERSMQAAVVVRDKIVAAWLDVSRMAI